MWVSGQQHGEAVDTQTPAGGRGQAILERQHELLVGQLRLGVAGRLLRRLLTKAPPLLRRIVELRVSIAQLLAAHEELEPLGDAGAPRVRLGQRRQALGVTDQEGGLACSSNKTNK